MFEGINISFTINSDSYGIGVENNIYEAYIGIKHDMDECKKTEQEAKKIPRKKLKPYRKPNFIKNKK